MRGYVVIADMTRTQRLRNIVPDDIRIISERESDLIAFGSSIMSKTGKPVAFIYNTNDLDEKRSSVTDKKVPFIVLGPEDDDQRIIEFFGETLCQSC